VLMQRAGLPSLEPYGVAELTPERECLIVVDLANMLLCLALRSSPSRSTSRPSSTSRSARSPRRSPAPAGWPCPPQLRKLMRAEGRNLHAEFVRLPRCLSSRPALGPVDTAQR
jgi:hypothetical protein